MAAATLLYLDAQMSVDTSSICIKATHVLHAVTRGLGGSEPIYEDITMTLACMEYALSFNIPSKDHSDGMVHVTMYGTSYEYIPDEAKEDAARAALDFLRAEHGIHVLDYNWFRAEEFRMKCLPLIKQIDDIRNIYDLAYSRCKMVVDGILLASYLFISKACDLENHITDYAMASVYRGCAADIQKIHQSFAPQVWKNFDSCMCARANMQSNINIPCSEDPQLKTKVHAVMNVSIGLKLILNEVASRAGFQLPIVTVDHVGSGYRGYVHLSASESIAFSSVPAHTVSSIVASEESEAKNGAMFCAIDFISRSHGLKIMDPSFYMLRNLEMKSKEMKTELHLLSSSSSHITRIVETALNEVHNLARRHRGLTGERDAYLKGLMISGCNDLARCLDPLYSLLGIARQNSAI